MVERSRTQSWVLFDLGEVLSGGPRYLVPIARLPYVDKATCAMAYRDADMTAIGVA